MQGKDGWKEGGKEGGEGRAVNTSTSHPHTYLVLGIDQMPLRPRLLGSFQRRILHRHGQAGVDGRGSRASGGGGRHDVRLGLAGCDDDDAAQGGGEGGCRKRETRKEPGACC